MLHHLWFTQLILPIVAVIVIPRFHIYVAIYYPCKREQNKAYFNQKLEIYIVIYNNYVYVVEQAELFDNNNL